MKPEIQAKFSHYPEPVKALLLNLRAVILDIITVEELGDVEETLKWGEPSYFVKGGSPVRFDWKPKCPDQYFVFFNCKTRLVETFRELHSDVFEFQGNRAIVLNVNETVPQEEIRLRLCIAMSLKYHCIKHLPFLGA